MTPVSLISKGMGSENDMSNAEAKATAEAVAEAFVSARRDARPLVDYPGTMPATLEAAYAVQDAAIRLDGGAIAGWKVGRVQAPHDATFATTRLSGPIFARNVVAGSEGDGIIFAGGFGAVEAEFLFRLGDVPAGKLHWSVADALDCVSDVHVGFEIASSPFPGINAHGPTVTISDFGNNNGLLVGPAVQDWRSDEIDSIVVTTSINGVTIATGQAETFPGGCGGSIAFLLENLACRGIPVAPGTWVSTGAVTGVHEVAIGSHATADFGGLHRINCRVVAAASAQN